MIRGLLVVLIAVATGGAYYFFSHAGGLPQAGAAPTEQARGAADTPVLPAAAAAGKGLRDPFAPPPGYGGAQGAGSVPAAGVYSPPAAAQATWKAPAALSAPVAVLTGIASGEGQELAIISYNGHTKPYAVGEMVGNSRVVAIKTQAVVLSGPSGQTVLPLKQR